MTCGFIFALAFGFGSMIAASLCEINYGLTPVASGCRCGFAFASVCVLIVLLVALLFVLLVVHHHLNIKLCYQLIRL